MNLEIPSGLHSQLRSLDGKGYKAYKILQGTSWNFGPVRLKFEHVQGDPYAAPSRLSATIARQDSGYPDEAASTPLRRRAMEDFILRRFWQAKCAVTDRMAGSGKSGEIGALRPGQKMLQRSAVGVDEASVGLIFFAGLPGDGRRILGRECARLFQNDIPHILLHTLTTESLDPGALRAHWQTLEDHAALSATLHERGWVGFVANGSRLPRRAGNSDLPMAEGAVPFTAPPDLTASVTLPHAGEVEGMPVPQGVTLLVGGGFHGKSTLLKALQDAVYPHIPGDGRERVAVDPTAVKIRAEDGRFAHSVDISPFLDTLPGVESTGSFTTPNASGSTSQAVNIVQALEARCQTLLLDEDTCATNFMVRDARMQALIEKAGEPITPFVDRVRELYDRFGVSTVLVMGGCGDYFDPADTVIAMERFQPALVTQQAKAVAARLPTGRVRESSRPFPEKAPGRVFPQGLSFRRGKREVNIRVFGLETLVLGTNEVETRFIEQFVETGQLEACGWLLTALRQWLEDEPGSTVDGAACLLEKMKEQGLSIFQGYNSGLLSLPRLQDVMAVLNRIRY